MSSNANWSAAGNCGARRASPASSSRPVFSSCRTFPQVNERRNEPQRGRRPHPAERDPSWRRDAARPCRRSNPAPAAIPATRQPIFTSGYAPVFAVISHGDGRGPATAARLGPSPGPARPATRDSGRRKAPRASSLDRATIASSRCPSELADRNSAAPIVPVQGALSALPYRVRARFMRSTETRPQHMNLQPVSANKSRTGTRSR